jgi:transcriptional regulator with XRE-family HTH domain
MDEQPNLKWGHLVETLRVLRGWTQEQLGEASGVYKTTISKHELAAHAEGRGRRPMSQQQPQGRTRVEEALGIGGRSSEVGLYLAELRERLILPERREEALGIEQAAAKAGRRMQAALWLGLEELRDARDGEPGLAWGVLIATLRTLLGWNQEDLARQADVDVTTVSRQELSTVGPRKFVREKLELALGLREGIAEEVKIEIGGLRAMMLAPKRSVVRAGIERAGDETARSVKRMLRRGMGDMRKLEAGVPLLPAPRRSDP